MTTNNEILSRYEIVTDYVLSRLPVQSLLRFRCICKNWNNLTKSPSFIEKHFNSESNRLRLMVSKFGVNNNPDPSIRIFSTYLLPDKIFSGCIPSHQLIYHCDDVDDFRCIYGPINGLFLLEKGFFINNGRFAWWNPATKEFRVVPPFEFDVKEDVRDANRRLGIGIDLVTGDYKIIWVRTFWDEYEGPVPNVYAAVYSTKNGSWKQLEPNFPYNRQLCLTQNCTHKNGKYHWVSTSKRYNDEGTNVYFIRTFDFSTDTFGEFEGPPIPGDHWVTLILRATSLATMSSADVTESMTAFYDIWVNIRENNWIKVYTINPTIQSHWFIGIWEYDKFIYEQTPSCKVVFYDQTTKQVTSLGFHFEELGFGGCFAMSYKESLFPITQGKLSDKDNIENFLVEI